MNNLARTIPRSAASGATKLVRDMLDLLLMARELLNQASDDIATLSLAVQSMERTGIKAIRFPGDATVVEAAPGDFWICDVTTHDVDIYLPKPEESLARAEVRVYLTAMIPFQVILRVHDGTINGAAYHGNGINHSSEWAICTGKEWVTR